jgi:hypothetical protein
MQNESKIFKRAQWRFILYSMIGYAFFYLTRKNLSMAQPDMLAEGVLLTVLIIAGNTLLRPLVNAINRIPINEAASEATYEVRLSVDADAVPRVRELLVAQQRRIIGGGGIVVEGRDIGSVVAPDAQVKVYLTADPAARALRRAAEEGGTDVAATEQSLLARDKIDSGRAPAPLVMADGAAHLDTTHHTLDEVIDQVVALVDRVA